MTGGEKQGCFRHVPAEEPRDCQKQGADTGAKFEGVDDDDAESIPNATQREGGPCLHPGCSRHVPKVASKKEGLWALNTKNSPSCCSEVFFVVRFPRVMHGATDGQRLPSCQLNNAPIASTQ
jgi:hypothetical protein